MRGESCLVTVAEKQMWEGLLWARVKSGVAMATEVPHCLTGFGARWEGSQYLWGVCSIIYPQVHT